MSLLSEILGISNSVARNPQFQQWKYWAPHPLCDSSRSHVLKDGETVVAHGCIWPIQLRVPSGCFKAFQLIDWAATPHVPGAGMQILRQCCSGMAAAFSLGGTPLARRILQAVGFKPYNQMSFLSRPLRPFQLDLEESPADWKTPARALRNLAGYIFPVIHLPAGWEVSFEEPGGIPESLWPSESVGQAVSLRSAQLLSHIIACPTIQRSACYVLQRKTRPIAYALLVEVNHQVRLADYGPPGLDEETSAVLGISAQLAARSTFPGATTLTAATSEMAVRLGLIRAGFRLRREEPIGVLKLNKMLSSVDRFRLTPIDWDAFCR